MNYTKGAHESQRKT